MADEVELRRCIECHEEYVPSYWDLLGVQILRGSGYCPKCSMEKLHEEERKEELARQAETIRICSLRREESGIPYKYAQSYFSNFDRGWQDKAFKICWDYAENFPVYERPKKYKSLYLWSNKSWGSGKTHLSCAIIHRIIDKWEWHEEKRTCPRLLWLSEPDLLSRIQGTYGFNNDEGQARESEDDIIRGIINADLVVLDDVGKRAPKDLQFIRRIIFSIINGRYNATLPMIITANLSPDELKRHLDEPGTEASFNRFYEMTGGVAINMDGKSYRKKEA